MKVLDSQPFELPRGKGKGSTIPTLQLGVLKDMISYQMRRAQWRIQQSFARRLDGASLTPGQLILLTKIRHNPGISQTALAKANGIERSTLGEIIDRFEKRQWVERRKHNSDRRAYALHLSPQGQALFDSVIPMALEQEAELTADWSEEDKSTLLRLLSKLAEA